LIAGSIYLCYDSGNPHPKKSEAMLDLYEELKGLIIKLDEIFERQRAGSQGITIFLTP